MTDTGFRDEPAVRPFLGVDPSISGRTWRERLDAVAANHALAMAQRHDVPDVLARVAAGRGVGVDDLPAFLDPSLRDLMPNPSSLTDMDQAADRIAAAIMNHESVAIFGDYDVDGASSTALLARYFAHFSMVPLLHIPDRITEGYGPNNQAIDMLASKGVTLLITVDCGTASFEAVDHANGLGMDVVVLDHHQTGEELPAAQSVVNPNRQDDLSGQGQLCAAGVVFLTMVAVSRALRAAGKAGPDLLQWIDLVALATICDVVPLSGLNRAFVRKGLIQARSGANAGLMALQQVARLNGPVSSYHLGFLLGPRINAGGRIGDAGLGARLLACDDRHEASEIAARLDDLNKERQTLEQVMLEQAIEQSEALIGDGDLPVCTVVESGSWHPGVVGLIASRLKDRYRRPAFAIAFDEQGSGSGSGRSIPGVDLGSAVRAAVDEGLLVKGGGHLMAAGMTVLRDNLHTFSQFLQQRLADDVAQAGQQNVLKIDAALTANAATPELVELLEQAGPFGAGHSEPVFAFPAHRITYAETVGAGHVRCAIASSDRTTLKAIAFRAADSPVGKKLLSSRGKNLHIAGNLSIDHWQGNRKTQLRVIDVADNIASSRAI